METCKNRNYKNKFLALGNNDKQVKNSVFLEVFKGDPFLGYYY